MTKQAVAVARTSGCVPIPLYDSSVSLQGSLESRGNCAKGKGVGSRWDSERFHFVLRCRLRYACAYAFVLVYCMHDISSACCRDNFPSP